MLLVRVLTFFQEVDEAPIFVFNPILHVLSETENMPKLSPLQVSLSIWIDIKMFHTKKAASDPRELSASLLTNSCKITK